MVLADNCAACGHRGFLQCLNCGKGLGRIHKELRSRLVGGGIVFKEPEHPEEVWKRQNGTPYKPTPAPMPEIHPPVNDPVNHPRHYKGAGGIECIEAIKASMDRLEFLGYLKGNSLKYLWRYRKKGGAEDLQKARWYIDRLTEEVKRDEDKRAD